MQTHTKGTLYSCAVLQCLPMADPGFWLGGLTKVRHPPLDTPLVPVLPLCCTELQCPLYLTIYMYVRSVHSAGVACIRRSLWRNTSASESSVPLLRRHVCLPRQALRQRKCRRRRERARATPCSGRAEPCCSVPPRSPTTCEIHFWFTYLIF